MARLLWTIWALMLHTLGLSIFRTCFANALIDYYGQPLVASPPTTVFLFLTSAYIIVVNSTLFPQSFRQPNSAFMCLYEFLATAFLLEFAFACLWTPLDVFFLDTLPTKLSCIFYRSGLVDAADTLMRIKPCMIIITHGVAMISLLTTLYVTKIADYKELTDNGVKHFLSCLGDKLRQRVWSELPITITITNNPKENKCRCNIRRKNRNADRDR